MRESHLAPVACALLALTLLVPAACSDKEAPPLHGSGPIGTGKVGSHDSTPGEAGVKDGAAGDSSPTLDGAAKDSQSTGKACKVDCDCSQGQACFNKLCSIESVPYYCCNKASCPAGLSCTDSLGQPGTCGSTGFCIGQCDCPQGLTCVSSLCTVTSTPTYCCTKAGCPSGSACHKANGSSGTCP